MTTTIMILVNGDLLLIIHGARVPNQHRGVLVESQARAVVDQVRVESLDGGQVMMITGLVMDGIQRAASRLITPIIVPKAASRLIARLPQSGPSHRHIPSRNILGNHIQSPGHLNQDPEMEVERSPRSGNH